MPIYPVVKDIFREILRTIGIEVVRKHRAAFLGSRHCERTYTSKHVCDHVFWFEQLHESLMLCM